MMRLSICPLMRGRSIDGKELLSSLHYLQAERERLVEQIDQRVEEMAARVSKANRRMEEELAVVGVRV